MNSVGSLRPNESGFSTESETAEESLEDEAERASAQQSPSVDVIFEVLKNERRRRVIDYLRTHEGPVELGTVAEHIAALENDKDPGAISYAERKRVYVGLYQCHLPKMDDMGVIEFNRARGRIEPTDQTHYLLPYLDGPSDHHRWYRYYGAIVLAGFASYGVAMTNSIPSVVTPHVVLLVLLVVLGACTLANVFELVRSNERL